MPRENNYISIENAEIGFLNFSGEARQNNAEGQRNFCVFLDEESAYTLVEDGWNIKWPKPRDDIQDDTRKPFLPVAVKFDPYPPNIYMVSPSRGTVKLDEGTVGTLDDADIQNVDVRIRPYHWTLKDGRTGIKAYVKDMYVTIQEDPFASKYFSGDR